MSAKYERALVLENTEISKRIYRLTIKCNHDIKPGQFYMLKSWKQYPILPRPISVHNVEDGKLSFLYEVRGEGTKMFSDIKPNEEIEILGPLGNGFDVNLNGRVAIVTGGIGIAPMYYTAKSINCEKLDIFAGFRDEVYLIDEFKKIADGVHIATDRGTVGHRGFVTELLNPSDYDTVLCCGPEIMMEKVAKACRQHGVKVFVSMEKHMACGVGACLVCTCKTKDGNKRTCKDGPVFPGEDVFLDA